MYYITVLYVLLLISHLVLTTVNFIHLLVGLPFIFDDKDIGFISSIKSF